MPNWCYTKIDIISQNKNQLSELHRLLNEWTSKNFMENGFGFNWLGNIVGHSGIGTVDTGDENELRCRGTLDYNDLENGILHVDTCTAWAPMLKMWQKLVEKYVPDAEIIYAAEEPGCELFETNDPDYIGLYIIDSMREDVCSDYEATEEDVIGVLQQILNTTENDLDDLLWEFTDSNIDDIYIHKWQSGNIGDWD